MTCTSNHHLFQCCGTWNCSDVLTLATLNDLEVKGANIIYAYVRVTLNNNKIEPFLVQSSLMIRGRGLWLSRQMVWRVPELNSGITWPIAWSIGYTSYLVSPDLCMKPKSVLSMKIYTYCWFVDDILSIVCNAEEGSPSWLSTLC